MDPGLVLDANIANPVAAIPAPVVLVSVSAAFGMPGCHHRTSRSGVRFLSRCTLCKSKQDANGPELIFLLFSDMLLFIPARGKKLRGARKGDR
jgi:hypothetical protein